ncbi:MAG: PsbP-related protein [Candidatus Doudnabacteria bacterium]
MEITPIQQQQDISPPKKTFTPKFIAVIASLLVLGACAVAGIWYWQSTISVPSPAQPVVHKDPTADWKTYTNSQYGFSFKYPPTLLVGLEGTGTFYSISILEPSQTAANSLVTFEVEPNGNPKNLPLDEWYTEQLAAFKLTPEQLPKTDITVGGKPAIRLDYSSTGQSEFHVIVQLNKTDLFHINYPKPPTKFDIDFDQIVSNVKFTEPSAAADTSTWKTYTNTKYGIAFKYPVDWSEGDVTTDKAGIVWINFNSIKQQQSPPQTTANNVLYVKIFPNQAAFTTEEQLLVASKSNVAESAINGLGAKIYDSVLGIPTATISVQNKYLEIGAPGGTKDLISQILSTFGFTSPISNEPIACIQVITTAKNPATGEVKQFPTPCDVPNGWVIVTGSQTQ